MDVSCVVELDRLKIISTRRLPVFWVRNCAGNKKVTRANVREEGRRGWRGVLEIPEDNVTECAGYHVIILGTVWGRRLWVEEAMGKYLDKKWRATWNESDSSGGRSIVSDEEEAAIEIDASNSEDLTTAQSL
jgi:hypothetical protein